ncbi:MAG: DUF2225 domain-containing protein [Firmicutes bacterium]|jgi:uncharacterized protein (DUF2225 family)|nr:DUF2225 domain-containing protein [Bacillota bacterium]NLL89133.1 DUF2225 domain-containing protein [Bacillota bacterium]HKM17637.1 DUF2225 domain-containing protein [Limnochordia bacterium]
MSRLQVVKLSAGTELFAHGQVPDAMYFILQGTVEIANEHSDLLGQGGLVGAVPFLNQIPARARACCVTDTELFKLTENNIITLFKRHPEIGLKILKALAAEVVGEVHRPETAAVKPKPLPTDLAQVLPAGHPQFMEAAPDTHGKYIFDTEAVCPVCSTRFPAVRVRNSRLVTARVEPDFRILYQDMEPLWYYVWVCPQCAYAYPYKQFGKIPHRQLAKVEKALRGVDPVKFQFSPRRTLDEVFLAYYLALNTFGLANAAPEQFGNLWMRLVWLYEDAEAQEWVEHAVQQALQHFEKALVSGRRSDAGDQKLYILIAELHQRLGQREAALRYLLEAVNLRRGSEGYRRLAADRIPDLRAEGRRAD